MATTKLDLENDNNIKQTVTATPTADAIPIANGSGTVNQWVSGYEKTYTAGEAIDASSTPQAVYLNSTDGKVYKTDASVATTTFTFIGFVGGSQNVAGDASVIVTQGDDAIVSGFTGLTIGEELFLTDTAGTVSSTAGTVSYSVAKVISTTEIIIQKGEKFVSGIISRVQSGSGSNDLTSVISLGFKPKKVTIQIATALHSNYQPVEYTGYLSGAGSNTTAYYGTSRNAYWINGTTYGIDFADSSKDSTYLYTYSTSGEIGRVSVSAYDEESLTFFTELDSSNTFNSSLEFLYIIEG